MYYTAELRNPTKIGNIYWGFIYNDTKERFRDGTYIHTSVVLEEIDDDTNIYITTRNSVYKLVNNA